MRPASIALGVSTVVLFAYLLFWPIAIEPVAWSIAPDPGLTGVHARNSQLSSLAMIAVGGRGPEDVTRGPDGYVYSGLEDGRIVRWYPDNSEHVTTYVNTGGRPLGLAFDADGYLIVADGVRGLLSVNPDRVVHVLTDSVGDEPLGFVNHLDIANDGTIWFSDSSQRFANNAQLDFMEGSATGRLLNYDPKSGKTAVRVEGLAFANGVAIAPGDEYVLVSETIAARIARLWLKGPRAGESELFANGLPGYPDNISYNDRGIFWIALWTTRVPAMDKLTDKPVLRSVLMRLPTIPGAKFERVAWAVGANVAGDILYSFQHWDGQYSGVTSVSEYDGALYLGSIEHEAIARLPVSDLDLGRP